VPLLGGKVVLVSGGTQSVGAGVARAAAREGAAVGLLGRSPVLDWDQIVFGVHDRPRRDRRPRLTVRVSPVGPGR